VRSSVIEKSFGTALVCEKESVVRAKMAADRKMNDIVSRVEHGRPAFQLQPCISRLLDFAE
jgi:hypothetical protein